MKLLKIAKETSKLTRHQFVHAMHELLMSENEEIKFHYQIYDVLDKENKGNHKITCIFVPLNSVFMFD